MNKGKVKLVKLNWDEECELDFLMGRGFEITEPAFKGKEEKNMYGIHSPLFATDWEDQDAFAERYSCRCKNLKGRVHENEVCPDCKTRVVFKDIDLSMTGWIRLHNNYIIHPIFFKMLKSIIGDKQFTEIIEFDKEITRDGLIVSKKSKNPFKGIGLVEFKDRFEEILSYYRDKKKNKLDLINEVLGEKDKVFASSIPVYSSILRPTSFKGETHFYNSIDRKLNTIFSLTRLLNNSALLGMKKTKKKNKDKMDEPTILYSVQKKLMEFWEQIFDSINQKEGHIKDQILGGRLNFSSRNVIIPDPELRADEVRFSYLTFLELYKYEIIAHLAKINDISENEAYEQWYKATINFSQKIYEIMMYLVKKRKIKVIINRNPKLCGA